MALEDTLKDIAANGLPSALDRFLGGSTGYDDPGLQPVYTTGGTGTQDEAYRPVDAVPGEQGALVAGVNNQTLLVGGVALVLTIGLIAVVVSR